MGHHDNHSLDNSDNWMARAQAASAGSLSPEQVELLLTDPHETVRAIAADLNREVPGDVILRVVEKFPQDAARFAFHADAPGICLGLRPLNWVGKPDLERYLDYRNATDAQRTRMVDLWTASGGGMATLAEMWTSEFGKS